MVTVTQIANVVAGRDAMAAGGETFEKRSPATGAVLWQVARSRESDVQEAVAAARHAQGAWAAMPAVKRGEVLHAICGRLEARREDVARVVAAETGTGPARARGETDGAILVGRFFAGEGQRLYGRTTTSAAAGKWAMTVREPLGVAGLIVAGNTPIANVAWKVFPALVCGNAVVLKAAEDTPATAALFAEIAAEAGLPPGLLNVVHGFGDEAGAPLVAHPDVAVVSFTGSSETGRRIAQACAARLARVSLELGGKNPLVICDDADLDGAVKWTLLSAFSNAGQRCAAASRIIIVDRVYDEVRARLVDAAARLSVGPRDEDDFGPVMSEARLTGMLDAIARAEAAGATLLTGGHRLEEEVHRGGAYLAPTILEGAARDAEISTRELFGPVTCLYRASGFDDAIDIANDSPYGLTACIHTRDIDRALAFTRRVRAGVAVVNAGTYGSEPHMPFGGVKQSGNGSREPGTEAIDVYSNLKNVFMQTDPAVGG